jgi:5-methylcytosine-specific restriction endonuclease McrA
MRRQRHWTYHEEKVRKAVLIRDNYECQIRGDGCLGTANSVDHIHPKAWGGRATPDNLRAACKPCNLSKGARAEGAQASRPFFKGAALRIAGAGALSPR